MVKIGGSSKQNPGRKAKLWAAIILFIAAVVQNFLFDEFNTRADELYAAMEARQRIDTNGLIHQLDYYVLSASPPHLSEKAVGHLRLFASKLFQSQVVAVAPTDFDTEAKERYLSQLSTRVSSVRNHDDLMTLVNFINEDGARFSDRLNEQWVELDQWRTLSRWSFLILYLLGGLVALRAELLDGGWGADARRA